MSQRGASMTEVILAVAVIVAVSPFMYNQILNMTRDSEDVAKANQIVKYRDGIINFLRVNQNKWEDADEIKMTDEEILASVDFFGERPNNFLIIIYCSISIIFCCNK